MSSTQSSEDENFDSNEIEERDFEAEKNLIVNNLLPKKSKADYELAYAAFLKWKHCNNVTKIDEDILLVYFKELTQKWKPSTLWSHWSKLRTTLNLRHNININEFRLLKSLLRHESKGYKPKKSIVLSFAEINQFLFGSDDNIYLAMKVILIFGFFGALRCQEMITINTTDVQDVKNVQNEKEQYIISIKDTKNEYPRQFVVGGEYYNVVKKYELLRPDGLADNRFFVQYQNGKCSRQYIGKNKISEVPKTIALYLNLKNPEGYTGHCLRRSSATAAANARLDFTKIKQLGGWRSDTVAEGYIENSTANREDIFNCIAYSHPR